VGETPAVVGLSTGGTGLAAPGAELGAATAPGAGTAGAYGTAGAAGLGADAGVGTTGQVSVITILRSFIPDVIEQTGGEGEPARVLSKMFYNPATNQLIVYNTPTNLKKLEDQLDELDVTPKQVSIETKYVTIKVDDRDKIGFNWDLSQISDINDRTRKIPSLETTTYDFDINGDGVDESIPFYSRPDGTSVVSNTITQGILKGLASPGPLGAFQLTGIITDNTDGDKLSVVMDYLNSLKEVELLSAPRVTTMNRKPAVIVDLLTQTFNTEVYNILQTSEAGFGGTPTTSLTQNLGFQSFNFGITLSVTPQISGTDMVRMWLNPQVTTKVGEDEFTQTAVVNGDTITSTMRFPRTTVQSVWTNVLVHDGDTLILGGLITDQTSKGEEKLPYLSEIPVLGFFFRGKSREVSQSSLLIFVTPDIIDPTGARFLEMTPG
jgi:type II secretory pathway component GspD/PulD (secretin)